MVNSTTSSLPSDWCFDASSGFVTDGAVIRVLAVPPSEAALIKGAKDQVEALYCRHFEANKFPVEQAKIAVGKAFHEAAELTDAKPNRTMLAYYDAKPDAPSDRVAAYTRVLDAGVLFAAAIAVTSEVSEEIQEQVLRAIALASEEVVMTMAHDMKTDAPGESVLVFRSQLGASTFLKSLFERDGYQANLSDRLEMTAFLKEMNIAQAAIENPAIDNIEIRALDLANDDVLAVYETLKPAFGPSPPSFETWKRHYATQPRFAPDMSFVAWQGDQPVAVSVIELVVESEGGGDDELMKVHMTESTLDDATKKESLLQPLKFPDDYEERREKIRASATMGYVCGISTTPAMRGKKLGQTLLRYNFQAAARAGLNSIYLGTDRFNTSAVRAYVGAGMVETKVENKGMHTIKHVTLSP